MLAIEGALQHVIGHQRFEKIAEDTARAWSVGVLPRA